MGSREINVRGQRDRAVVTLLLLEAPETIQRQVLADMLWPLADRTKSRASLRQSISIIKKTLASQDVETGFLERPVLGGDFVSLETELDLLEEFSGSLEMFKPLAARMVNQRSLLSSLDGISPNFDDWLSQTRTRLLQDAQIKLAKIFEGRSTPPDVRVLAADAVLRINEYDEAAIRAKMQTFFDQAENARALKVYADFVDLLDEELGAEPSLKTQDLAVEIKLAVEHAASQPQLSIPSSPTSQVSKVSLAVMPFTALGADPINKYDVLGILDQLTCGLSLNQAPAVISSNSTRGYINQDPRIAHLGDELGVAYVVTGSVRTQGDKSVVAVQLCDTKTEHVVWSWVKNCSRDDLISINSDVALQISNALSPSVNAAELSRTRDVPEVDLEPYHLMLRAKDRMFKLTQNGFVEAGHLLRQALQKKQDFAPAHALLAEWYSIRYWQRWSSQTEDDFAKMNDHVQRAMSLAPRDGRIMAMWGHFKIILERNYDAASELFAEAIDLNPNDSETLNWSVPTLAYSGHAALAVENAKKALRLSPYDPFMFRNEHFTSIAHYANGDFDEAAQYGLSSFKRVPTYTSNLRTTIAALVAGGRTDGLEELLAAHREAEPQFSVNRFLPNHGFRDEDQRMLYGKRLMDAGLSP